MISLKRYEVQRVTKTIEGVVTEDEIEIKQYLVSTCDSPDYLLKRLSINIENLPSLVEKLNKYIEKHDHTTTTRQ